MIHSDFDVLPGGNGWGRRQLDELTDRQANQPYDWIERALLAFLILVVTGAISYGLFYFWPNIATALTTK